MEAKDLKSKALRALSAQDLTKKLTELQKELQELQIAKVSSGVASKLAKIRVVRKAIARILTISNQKAREELKANFQNRKSIPHLH